VPRDERGEAERSESKNICARTNSCRMNTCAKRAGGGDLILGASLKTPEDSERVSAFRHFDTMALNSERDVHPQHAASPLNKVTLHMA
jgi:hypothetical protein